MGAMRRLKLARRVLGLLCTTLLIGGAMATTAVAEPPPPPGANPSSCRPSTQNPDPVILVHGTFENRFDNWEELSPELASLGYCVYALDYGANQYTADTFYGLAHVARSAGQVAAYVQQVLAATGAT